nr:MAG TPA: hypothetical protein [Caudoviricetes sp.]
MYWRWSADIRSFVIMPSPTVSSSKGTDLNRPAQSLNNAWAYPLGDRGVEAHTAGNNRGRGQVGAAMQKADTINHERQSCP